MYGCLVIFIMRITMTLSSKYNIIVQVKEESFIPLRTVLNIVRTWFLFFMAVNEILNLLQQCSICSI